MSGINSISETHFLNHLHKIASTLFVIHLQDCWRHKLLFSKNFRLTSKCMKRDFKHIACSYYWHVKKKNTLISKSPHKKFKWNYNVHSLMSQNDLIYIYLLRTQHLKLKCVSVIYCSIYLLRITYKGKHNKQGMQQFTHVESYFTI